MAANSMHNIATLIKRLEAVTSRLEDIASSADSLGLHPNEAHTVRDIARALAPVSTNTPEPQRQYSGGALARPPEDIPVDVTLFDSFVKTGINPFFELSQKIGGVVANQATVLRKGFDVQRRILLVISKAKKPHGDKVAEKAYKNLLQPIEDVISSIRRIQQENRGTSAFNMLSAVADGSFALTWTTAESRPWIQAEESLTMAQFFGNKVLKEHPRDSLEAQWVETYYALFTELASFLREAYPYGITWNSQGDALGNVITGDAA
ncbi:unnamed protein product [Clonostachys rosea f. rosea IK726]|uniref:Uncharacterized protein n=1 Tax=Clonostachys rosea f. rosea IK726 TaxID=1349383 RepID=A0ACA9TWH4_BIOOC|nr:unnamed protein product [Clonostachys rosea f. rosea IK726]